MVWRRTGEEGGKAGGEIEFQSCVIGVVRESFLDRSERKCMGNNN
jgi:hypothetical protein